MVHEGKRWFFDVNIYFFHEDETSEKALTLTIIIPMFVKIMRSVQKFLKLRKKITLIAGRGDEGYHDGRVIKKDKDKKEVYHFNPSVAKFNFPCFLKLNQDDSKLYISDCHNHCIRRISMPDSPNVSGHSVDSIQLVMGNPKSGYFHHAKNHGRVWTKHPQGFDWDLDHNMYVCTVNYVCKIEAHTGIVSIFVDKSTDSRSSDSSLRMELENLTSLVCLHEYPSDPIQLYLCDHYKHSIFRHIDGKTLIYAGKESPHLDMRYPNFDGPWDIVKDGNRTLYVSDMYNHEIKMIDIKNNSMETFVGDRLNKTILHYPRQICLHECQLYVTCDKFKNCVVMIDKHLKVIHKIVIQDDQYKNLTFLAIACDVSNQCIYLTDMNSIYRLE